MTTMMMMMVMVMIMIILTMTMTIMAKDKESLRRKMRHDDFDHIHDDHDPIKSLCLRGRDDV